MNWRTRRGFLAGVGTAALVSTAGCGVFDRHENGDSIRVPSNELETVLESPVPDVLRPAPVQPESETIEAGMARCSELIATVPESISATEIPNEVVRQEVEQTRRDAVEALDAVETEPDRFRRLDSIRSARKHAREAAVGFEAVRGDPTANIREERRETRTAIGMSLARVEYLGTDRRRTLLTAFRVEEFLTDARRRLTHGVQPNDPNALNLAAIAGDVEYASATNELAEALTERHAATVDDPIDFVDSAAAALESSMISLSRAELPDSRTPVSEVFGEEPARRDLQYLASESVSAVRRWQEQLSTELSEGRFASGLSRAIQLERDARALETVVTRIDGDDIPAPETADAIRNEREAALKAANSISTSASEPSLAGDSIARLYEALGWTDAELERYLDRDREVNLSREYARYAYLRARMEAFPDAIDTVRERLDAYAW